MLVAPSLYRRRACRTTADTSVPSASARAFAASQMSSGTRIFRSGVPLLGVDGGISLELYAGGMEIDICIQPSGVINLVMSGTPDPEPSVGQP